MDTHLVDVRDAAKDNEFLDVAEPSVSTRNCAAFCSPRTSSTMSSAESCPRQWTYLVRADDEEDDAEVVAAALRRIRQLAEARTGSQRPTT